MLNAVRNCIAFNLNNDQTFAQKYNEYVMQIQDMDIENEILPLIKRESTEYLKLQNKLVRQNKRRIRKMSVDMQR